MEIKWDMTKGVSKHEWAQIMIDSGFTISKYKIETYLDVSRNWINEIINPAIDYIKLPKTQIIQMQDSSICYYHEEQLREWCMEHGVFTQQSELFSLEAYAEAICNHPDTKVKHGIYQFSNAILADVGVPSYVRIVNERNRAVYPAVPVPKIDIWDTTRYRIHVASTYSVTELLYRQAISRGWIKCTFGDKKTVFVEELKEEWDYCQWTIAIPKRG